MYTEYTSQSIVSYLTLRRVVGVLGVALPVLLVTVRWLIVGNHMKIETSLSAYYGTEVGDIFVGILFVIGWFLFSYRGYERKDDIAGDFAWLFALGVALFPTTSPHAVIRVLHSVSAALLFLVLAYFSYCLFTKTKDDGSMTDEKKKRNGIYKACAVIMLVCIIIAIALSFWLPGDATLAALSPIFWLESLAMWAFGVSWFVKGETLWKDAKPGR